jgi:uncharacterized phage protein (predicted DNA packaging)
MIIELEEAKTFAKIDYDEENEIVQLLIDVASEGLKNATGILFDSTNNLARLYCLVMVKDLYDNREMTVEKASNKIRYTIQSIMTQLKYCYPPEVII